jgi:small subunit ribosomal protein S11
MASVKDEKPRVTDAETTDDGSTGGAAGAAGSNLKPTVLKKGKKAVHEGRIYICATFNNTLISITNKEGGVISQSSAGSVGFKGSRKSTPYAATLAMQAAVTKAKEQGLKMVVVYVKGLGPGREAAIRALQSENIAVTLLCDQTPIPHNGPRPRKKRRV